MTTLHLPHVDEEQRSVSRFDVERLAVGELTGDEKARVEAAVAADPALRAFFDDVVASDKAFLFAHPPAAFFSQAAPPPTLGDKVRAFFTSAQLLSSLAAAAAVVVIVNAPLGGGGPREQIKGGAHEPAVSFFVQEGDVARLGHEGDALRAGDKIQLAVKDVDKAAMVVVGVDGSGAVSVYAKEAVSSTSKGPSSLASSKPRLLPASLVLDDTVGAERFFVVYGDDLDALEAAARAAAARLGDDVKAGRRSLESTARLDVDGPQSSVHILKVR